MIVHHIPLFSAGKWEVAWNVSWLVVPKQLALAVQCGPLGPFSAQGVFLDFPLATEMPESAIIDVWWLMSNYLQEILAFQENTKPKREGQSMTR